MYPKNDERATGSHMTGEEELLKWQLATAQNELAEARVEIARLEAKVRYETARADFCDGEDTIRELRTKVAMLEAQRDR
jgi:outer membrane PBP1 activator LpoA protein